MHEFLSRQKTHEKKYIYIKYTLLIKGKKIKENKYQKQTNKQNKNHKKRSNKKTQKTTHGLTSFFSIDYFILCW